MSAPSGAGGYEDVLGTLAELHDKVNSSQDPEKAQFMSVRIILPLSSTDKRLLRLLCGPSEMSSLRSTTKQSPFREKLSRLSKIRRTQVLISPSFLFSFSANGKQWYCPKDGQYYDDYVPRYVLTFSGGDFR